MTGPGVLHEQSHDESTPTWEYAFKADLTVTGDSREPVVAEYRALLRALSRTRVVHDRAGVYRRAYEAVLDETAVMRPGYLTRVRNGIWDLLVIGARLLDPAMKADYRMPRQDIALFRMDEVNRFIHDNMNRNIVAAEIARQLALGEKQLGRLVRQQTGMSPHAYILAKKVGTAVGLIRQSADKLSVIADATGFSSEFHLSRAVKKATGTAPGALRRRNG